LLPESLTSRQEDKAGYGRTLTCVLRYPALRENCSRRVSAVARTLEAVVVDVYRTIGVTKRSRTYSVPEPGIAGVVKIEITITVADEKDWGDAEPAAFGAIGCILGPGHADKAVLVR